MSLTGRLTVFYLTALALVLAGFSASLFLLARAYLHRRVGDQLRSALDVLTAAAEVGRQGVEWEPQERQLTLGQDDDPGQVRWTVHDHRGRPVQRSHNLHDQDLIPGGELANDQEVERQGEAWRVMRRTVTSPRALPSSRRRPPFHEALVLTSGLSLEPVRETLRNLALALGGISAALWFASLLMVRRLCRRALVPLTRMAATARAMGPADHDRRLPVPVTGDELEDLGRAFNDLLARLQEAFLRQQRFTGDASHQLRTPLTAVLGQIEVVLRRERSAAEYRQVLQQVHGQGLQLRQIVEMLLFLARADAEALAPTLETIDLAEWLPEYLRAGADQPRSADLRPEIPGGGHFRVKVQPALLAQLLDNLLDNARKYSPPGTPVVLRLGRDSGRVTLSVEDRGCGIAPEDLPHVFEPFYRGCRVYPSAPAGVGLGLAVVQRIAQRFGGEVRPESGPGGSCFQLLLPQADDGVTG
jgi:signal transduction histidine kinase